VYGICSTLEIREGPEGFAWMYVPCSVHAVIYISTLCMIISEDLDIPEYIYDRDPLFVISAQYDTMGCGQVLDYSQQLVQHTVLCPKA
jgi:hypothetical protein